MEPKRYKYIDYSKNNLKKDTPGFWDYQSSKKNNIDDESFLLLPKNISKKNMRKKISEEIEDSYNQFNQVQGPIGSKFNAGRGFGNLDVSNDIRFGINSRSDFDKFKKKREELVQDRFEYLDRNFQNPKNIILPFPRGGEITRSKVIIQDIEANKNKHNENYDFKY